MGREIVEKILSSRGERAEAEGGETKFYSILQGDLHEHFLEIQFRQGLRTCFSYTDLLWFNYDPEGGCLDLEFGGYLVTIKGRGLAPTLFTGLKQKRVSWIREAATDAEDHPKNEIFIDAITITPPGGTGEGEGS
jgi:hypothetical protein